jgi:predicted metal-binding membrane protein
LERPRAALLVLSFVVWLAMATVQEGSATEVCGSSVRVWLSQIRQAEMPSVDAASALWVVASWCAMVVAMMGPSLAGPLRHVWNHSLSRRRVLGLASFVAGYLVAWMLAALVLLPLSAYISMQLDEEGRLFLLGSIALFWQVTPLKQICLNRCHAVRSLAPFSPKADVDCATYGLLLGAWCVASCWALMLLALGVNSFTQLAMVLVALLVFVERLLPSRPPAWRPRVVT